LTINSKQKGSRGERELAGKFREYGFTDARRTQQYCGNTGDASDCVGLPGIHVECKRVERLNITDAVEQAIRDASGDNLPTVFHRKNNEKWLVTMPLDSWMKMYHEFATPF